MPDNFQAEFEQMKQDIADLKRADQFPHIEIDTDLFGVIDTVSAVPTTATNIPKTFFDQMKLYRSGTTFTLYLYDVVNKAWRSVTLT